MIVTIPISSYVVSGVSMFLLHFVFLAVLKWVLTSIAKSTNIRRIYDQRLSLCPKKSHLGITNTPVAHAPVSRTLAVLSLLYLASAIYIDFSITGSSRKVRSSSVYRSVVSGSMHGHPIDIDYDSEFKMSENGTRFMSRRLVALMEIGACRQINFSNHRMYAYAFKRTHLDKTLIPMLSNVPDAQCVTSRSFETEMKIFEFKEVPFATHHCPLHGANFSVTYEGDEKITTAKIISKGECDLNILTMQCSKHNPQRDMCTAIGTTPSNSTQPGATIVITIWDWTSPQNPATNQLRDYDPTKVSKDDLVSFGRNVAFFTSINIPDSLFTYFYMSYGAILQNVSLTSISEQNITEMNLLMVLPVLILQTIGFCILGYVEFALRKKIIGEHRADYISFISVDDVFDMVNRNGLQKSRDHEDLASSKLIKLKDGRPQIVFEDENPY